MNRSTHRRVANGLSWVGHILLATLLLSLLAGQVAAKDRITYFHNDALGSPVAATNEAGEALWREDYAPYGARLLREDDGANALWYTGKQEEEALGLHYYGARWYDAEIGRFLSLDPVGFDEANLQSFNKYAYANNNPYRFVDPDGANAVTAFGGLLTESYNFVTGNGFNGAAILGALKDGYNGEGKGFASSAAEDVLSFGGGALGAASKLHQLAKAGKAAKNIPVSRARYGEAADHISDAQRAGHPDVLTIARPGAPANRNASIGGLPRVPGKQLDEYPPAMFKEGGAGASVRPINPRDNMGAGACIGNACRALPDGARVKIKVVD